MTQDANNPLEIRQQADERLAHALLLQLNEDAAQRRDRQISAVINAIEAPTPIRFHVWARRFAAAAAAIILIAVALWALTYNPNAANAAVNQMIAALSQPGDRTFLIHMRDLPEPPGHPELDERTSVPKPGLDGATLYLRDSSKYVLARIDPNGGRILDGFDGQRSWRVRRGALAEIKEGMGAGGIPMPPIMADVPFSDLPRTLERICADYSVSQCDRASLPDGNTPMRHLLVRRNSRSVKGPQTIEIWADGETAMPRRIVFDHAKIQGSRAPCRVTLDLLDEDPLPADWFEPAPHEATSKAAE